MFTDPPCLMTNSRAMIATFKVGFLKKHLLLLLSSSRFHYATNVAMHDNTGRVEAPRRNKSGSNQPTLQLERSIQGPIETSAPVHVLTVLTSNSFHMHTKDKR